jgi:hypothetical protein
MTISPPTLELWCEVGKKTYNLFVYDDLYRLYPFPLYRYVYAFIRIGSRGV